MSAIRQVIITSALGLAIVTFMPVAGSAQSSNNPSTVGQTGVTGQPTTNGTGASAIPAPSNPQQGNGSGVAGSDPNPTTNAAPNSTTDMNQPAQPVGTAGQTGGQTAPARSGGHAGLIAFIVVVGLIVLAFVIAGSKRRTTVTHHRIS